jgi:hypothetical protein
LANGRPYNAPGTANVSVYYWGYSTKLKDAMLIQGCQKGISAIFEERLSLLI